MKILILLLIPFILFGHWKTKRENLQHIYTIDDFRIFYSTTGKDSIVDKKDINNNNIPDFIENLGLQFEMANEILHEQLAFKKPLQNTIYKDRTKYIDIHILKLKKGQHGVAGDAIIKYNYKVINSDGKSISMAIANNLSLGNLTPLHELFHIYQNGYTLIKNSFYTEGTARWSEMIFRRGFGKTRPLPTTPSQIDTILKQRYKTKYFWNRLGFLCSSKKRFDISKYKDIKYIGTKKNIIQTNDVHGFEFMELFLTNLGKIDDEISKIRGFENLNWKEKYQKDKYNNKYILKAVLKTIKEKKIACKSNEMNNFITLLSVYIENM